MPTKSLKADEVFERMAELGVEVGVVVAFGRLLPPELLAVPRHGFVNLHPSLLPRHRGPSPMQWALVCGDRITGVTTMLLDEGMDTGPILLQERAEVEPWATADDLAPRLAGLGADLVVRTLDGLEDGAVVPKPATLGRGSVTPDAAPRNFGKVDWTMPSRQLVNRLRGFTPLARPLHQAARRTPEAVRAGGGDAARRQGTRSRAPCSRWTRPASSSAAAGARRFASPSCSGKDAGECQWTLFSSASRSSGVSGSS